jgi:NAD(P)-dependent dehydrogenase (short-subunit alcohol dehydrogenase family)
VFGVVAVTNAFLPALQQSARPPDRERLQRHRIPDVGHRPAVSALVWQARRLPLVQDCAERAHGFYARTLADDGIKVNALAPSLRRTDLNATAAASGGDPAEAAAGAVRLALLPDDGPTG